MGMNLRLRGKVAVITGAASGVGEAIARNFAREGAKVVVVDIEVDRGNQLVEQINEPNPRHALFVEADVTRDDDSNWMLKAATDHFGGLDILVNNASSWHVNKPMLEVTEAEYDRMFAVNVKAIFLAARHAVPLFEKRGGGSILNIGSTAALRPRTGMAWYSASKGAVLSATKAMALELAPRKVRVNAINPVLGEYRHFEDFLEGEDTPERRAEFIETIPLGRLTKPSDVANAAVYLASDEASFITGVSFEVDGGRCI